MKRTILLALFGLFSFGSLVLLYQKSESLLVHEHGAVLKLFMKARTIEAVLERDVLESRNYLLSNYDSFVDSENYVQDICEDLVSPELGIYKKLSEHLNQSIDEYCLRLSGKLEKVETFKSKNAILRNSLSFVQKLGADIHQQVHIGREEEMLIQVTLAYALISTPESKSALEDQIQKISKIKIRNVVLAQAFAHAKRIHEIKEALDLITREIVSSNSEEKLENLRRVYFIDFQKAESQALFFKNMMFLACLLLLGFIIYNLLLLGRMAAQLDDTNLHLEERVVERTKELSESRDVILQQQEIIAVTAKMSALGEMASGIAHEVNTPLTVIQLRTNHLLKTLKNDGFDREKAIHSLSTIDRTVKRIDKIVNGLKTFSREGKEDPKIPYSVSKMVDETFSLCRERFYHGDVDLTFVCDKDFDLICRSHEISQVLLNMLNNAFDAIEGLPKKWIRVEFKKTETQILMIVEDCGAGIPLAVQEKMLQPFFTTKAVGKGTGLGLSISKKIVEDHGGRITIDNDCKNTRIVVTFSLPAETISQAA